MEQRPWKQRLTEALVRYGLFLIFSAGSVWLMLQFRRAIILFGIYRHMWGNDIWLMDLTSLVAMVVLFLAFMGLMDHYFLEKTAPSQGGAVLPVLLNRAKKIALTQVAMAFFAVGTGWLFQYLTLHR